MPQHGNTRLADACMPVMLLIIAHRSYVRGVHPKGKLKVCTGVSQLLHLHWYVHEIILLWGL